MVHIDPTTLSIEDKVGQTLFIGIPGTELDGAATRLIESVRPGGVCLFARNISELRQTRSLLDGLRGSLAIEPFLSIDQEGGRVDRLRRVFSPMPAPSKLRSVEDARELGSIIGAALSTLGFNMDFAPVVDVIDEERSTFINGLQSRGFGKSPQDVVSMAQTFLDSLADHGILGCLKHFPGLAASKVDSHEELPIVSVDRTELSEVDLLPFRRLLRREDVCVMVAHATYPNAGLQVTPPDGKLLPSSLDPDIVTSLLRDELSFEGVAVTDDLEMGAIVRHFGIGDASVAALKAGEDMVAICASEHAIREAYESILNAVLNGDISMEMLDRSVGRIAGLKARMSEPADFDDARVDEIRNRIQNLNQSLN